MIVEGLFTLVRAIADLLASALPAGYDAFPALSNLDTFIGSHLGPVDRFFPVSELFSYLDLIWHIWVPAVLAYLSVFWVYRHLPFIGKG